MFKGKVNVRSQLGNFIEDTWEVEGKFETRKQAEKAAREKSVEIEKYYTPYHNHEIIVEELI